MVSEDAEGKKYVTIAIPDTSLPVSIKRARFVVRDYDGATLAEGFAAVETDPSTGDFTVVMSPPEAYGISHTLENGLSEGNTQYDPEIDFRVEARHDANKLGEKLEADLVEIEKTYQKTRYSNLINFDEPAAEGEL